MWRRIQSILSQNKSDGNRFSSLKAKNILRFSVIPSLRKTSSLIIANSDRACKWEDSGTPKHGTIQSGGGNLQWRNNFSILVSAQFSRTCQPSSERPNNRRDGSHGGSGKPGCARGCGKRRSEAGALRCAGFFFPPGNHSCCFRERRMEMTLEEKKRLFIEIGLLAESY